MKQRFVTCVLLWCAAVAGTALAKPPYQVFGYYQDADNLNVAQLPFADLTCVVEAFAIPGSSGTLSFSPNTALVSAAHSNSTRVYFSIGGQSVSDSTWASACSSGNLTTFVNNIMNVVTTDGYDGVDIDWEFPNSGDGTQFMNLMQALYPRLHGTTAYDGNPRGLNFFISPGYFYCGVNWATVGQYCDFGTLSGYDYGLDSYNGPTSDTATFTNCLNQSHAGCLTDSAQTLQGLGFPLSQLILGCPLYTKPSNTSILNEFNSGATVGTFHYPQDEASLSNGDIADVDQSFCRKINWAVGAKGMPGIALWEIGDAFLPNANAGYATTQLTNIWNVIGGTSSCLSVGTPTPTPTPVVQSSWRINAGGPQYTDTQSNVWAADQAYSGGTGAASGGAISGTPDPTLYDTQRYGTSFSYSFAVPAGSYQVTLKFAETYSGDFGVGDRVFNVTINGAPALTNFDIFAQVGANAADDQVFNNIAPAGGLITIQFTGTSSPDANAVVEALQVIPEPASTPTPTPSPTATRTRTGTATATASRTVTPSPTGTGTRTGTATATASRTGTPSPTGTGTRTGTATATASRTGTPSPTGTGTRTGTATATPSPTLTDTAAPTATASPSPTPPPAGSSPTSTPTATPSISPSPTSSASPTKSPTETQSPTATGSDTPPPSATFTETFTAPPTATATETATASPTASATQAGATASPTDTASPTPSASPTSTAGSTATATRTETPTDTPAPGPASSGPGGLMAAIPVPNPCRGPDLRIAFRLSGWAPGLSLRVYTPAMVLAGLRRFSPPAGFHAGWNQAAAPDLALPDGTYFCVASAGGASVLFKLTVLK